MSKIFIMSGAVHTGKTTRLMQWSMAQKNIDGIFQPLVDEKRFIYHIASRTLKMLQTGQEKDVTEIGKYKFSNETFLWARKMLQEASLKEPDWLLIDEIGPLELKGLGLEPAITEILSRRESLKTNILCVVRDSVLEKFIDNYGLKDSYEIFKIDKTQI
jgi:nucleoside-triphosphatase THEP1